MQRNEYAIFCQQQAKKCFQTAEVHMDMAEYISDPSFRDSHYQLARVYQRQTYKWYRMARVALEIIDEC